MIRAARKRRHDELIDRYGASKQVVYNTLISSGFYLPPINSPTVTREYLLAVNQINVLSQQRSVVRPYRWCYFDKEIAYCVLEEIAEKSNRILGFDITTMPSKEWMINMAYATDPEHDVFLDIEQTVLNLNEDNFQQVLINQTTTLPTPDELKARYRTRLVNAYKQAITTRLISLGSRYKCITVNLSSPLIN